MSKTIRVFIENPAGQRIKNIHDEKTLEFKGSLEVARPYPFPYGFIIGTTSEDGGNLDCFVLTNRAFKRGEIVDCSAIDLMEQFEDGDPDHNILANLDTESVILTEPMKAEFRAFVANVFSEVRPSGEDVPDFLYEKAQLLMSKNIKAGEFLGGGPALKLIERCIDMEKAR